MNRSSNFRTPIEDTKIDAVLGRLHALAEKQEENQPDGPRDLEKVTWGPDFLKDMMIPIHASQGAFLYLLARSIRARTVVEFGTSYGVSTIYFAAAIRDNGETGKVIGTEFVPEKVRQAKCHLEEAGLLGFAEIREGDARQTLKNLPDRIDLCLMDGFPPYSLEVFRLIAPRLRPGAIVVADGTKMLREPLREFLAYLGNPANGFRYVELPFGDGTGFAVKSD